MNEVGARTKLSEEVTQTFCDAFEKGYSNVVACAYAGISERTYYDWLDYAREEREEFVEFERKIKLAKAKHLAFCQEELNKAMQRPDSWQTICWSLERRNPQEYALNKPRQLPRLREALKQFRKNEISYTELNKVILEMTAEGEINTEDQERLLASISKAASVEEITELKKIVERLEVQHKT